MSTYDHLTGGGDPTENLSESDPRKLAALIPREITHYATPDEDDESYDHTERN